ncbi:MAG TPA: YdcH family protein [Hyphomonas sp.]|nr:YdcH family protein [Hyphomonas sp.]MCB9962200.1 YdcH family protein [Hyphomonas sp.]HPE49326.1 YdcH family protein [Hyphomonas sp.]
MSHTPHELTEEFPEAADKIHELKESNAHFARLADEYHALNREIHRIETDLEPASDEHQTELRKKRMALKDEIYAMLKA